MRIGVYGLCSALLFLQRSLIAQTTSPANDAAVMYEAADAVVARSVAANIMCPANSSLIYFDFPYSNEWLALEKADFAANGKARAIAHQASSMDHANWPPDAEPKPDYMWLSHLRELANDLADAAVYQHLQGDDAAAVETIQDLLHMADLIKDPSDKDPSDTRVIRFLVSVGIQAMAMDRLNVISSRAVFTKDPGNKKDLQISIGRNLIAQLVKHEDGKTEAMERLQGVAPEEIASGKINIITTANRSYAERDMAAMSLACHLYKFDTGHWPQSLDDLHIYLPDIPIDPFGDGKQTLGYALIKAGLPDGADRPLVYSRENANDDLFFRTDRPLFSYYNDDGSAKPFRQQKRGGQFRDVTGWVPDKSRPSASTTRPLKD